MKCITDVSSKGEPVLCFKKCQFQSQISSKLKKIITDGFNSWTDWPQAKSIQWYFQFVKKPKGFWEKVFQCIANYYPSLEN